MLFRSKQMKFRTGFFSSIVSIVLSGLLGIILAPRNYGVWALVYQQMSYVLINCIILLVALDWHPRLEFSLGRVRLLFSFGGKLLGAAIIDVLFRNLYSLLIGKIYNSEVLGLYNRGQSFPLLVVSNLDGSIQSVMLPSFASNNDNLDKMKSILRRSITLSSYVLIPCLLGMAATANSLILVLITQKWLGCIPFLQLAAIAYIVNPIHSMNISALSALGRSDILFKLEIVKKSITVVIMFISIPFGIYYMAAGQIVISFVSSLVNAYPNKRLLGYSYREQISDLLPTIAISIIMAIIVWLIGHIDVSPIVLLVLQVITGIAIYIILSIILKLQIYSYLMLTMKDLFNRRGGRQ